MPDIIQATPSVFNGRQALRVAASTVVAGELEEVFRFFSDARNLTLLTPPWIDFKIITEGEIEMRPGALIDYRIKIHNLPIRWRTEITEWNPPHSFVDNQLSGPYRLWHHRHTFASLPEGTQVEDEVHYWPKGGQLMNRLFVQKDVERIFRHRAATLHKLFGS